MPFDEKGICKGLFHCTRCGDCCKGFGGTYVTRADIRAIAQYLSLTPERLVSRYTQRSGGKRLIAQNESGYCVFWDRVCTIHPVKPRMCRQWPFIEPVLIDVGNWRSMAASCPGMKADAPEDKILACVKASLTRSSEST